MPTTPARRLFVNIRASYADEVNTLLSFLSNELRYTKVSAFYQNESIQVAGFTDLNLAFNLLGLKARHARLLVRVLSSSCARQYSVSKLWCALRLRSW
jgi:hypothetical protein